jgi:hypothetical protein
MKVALVLKVHGVVLEKTDAMVHPTLATPPIGPDPYFMSPSGTAR